MLSLCITRLSGKSKMYGQKNKTKKADCPRYVWEHIRF